MVRTNNVVPLKVRMMAMFLFEVLLVHWRHDLRTPVGADATIHPVNYISVIYIYIYTYIYIYICMMLLCPPVIWPYCQ